MADRRPDELLSACVRNPRKRSRAYVRTPRRFDHLVTGYPSRPASACGPTSITLLWRPRQVHDRQANPKPGDPRGRHGGLDGRCRALQVIERDEHTASPDRGRPHRTDRRGGGRPYRRSWTSSVSSASMRTIWCGSSRRLTSWASAFAIGLGQAILTSIRSARSAPEWAAFRFRPAG